MRKLLKEVVRITDKVRVIGGERARGRGIRMADGSPVSVEHIMKAYGVDREKAEEIARRPSQ